LAEPGDGTLDGGAQRRRRKAELATRLARVEPRVALGVADRLVRRARLLVADVIRPELETEGNGGGERLGERGRGGLDPADLAHEAEELSEGDVVIAEHVALADAPLLLGGDVTEGDVVDGDAVEAALAHAGHLALQERDHDATRGRGRGVARA